MANKAKENTTATLSVADKADICLMVKQAKDPKEQMKICADLYRCTLATIRCVLREAGMEYTEKEATPEAEPKKEIPMTVGPQSAIAPFDRASAVLSLIRKDDPKEVKAAALAFIDVLVYAEASAAMGGGV